MLNPPDVSARNSQLFEEVRKELTSASSVLIGTHLNPDGDALGSALAAASYLDSLGIENEIVCHHPAPKNLRFLPGVGRIRQVPKLEKHDLGLILDLDSMERLGDTAQYFEPCGRLIVIDHHLPHEAPGDIRIVDTTAPATAVLLYRLLDALDAPISPAMATCLLTGIVTDTGSFRFRNTTAEALKVSASLLEHGADINLVSENIFQCKPISSVRLLGQMLESLQLVSSARIAWSLLWYDDFQRLEAQDEDTEGFVNELLAIESVQIAAVARETKPGKIRVSLRSTERYDVAAVARVFGGGGHRNAAGCTLEGPVDEEMARLVEQLKKCLESL